MRNLIPIFCLLLFGCDLSDFKFPEVPKHQDSTEEIQSGNDKTVTPRSPAPNFSTNQSELNQQDPQKKFQPVNHFITRGKPIHPYPSDLNK
jgi:hypothetical protein